MLKSKITGFSAVLGLCALTGLFAPRLAQAQEAEASESEAGGASEAEPQAESDNCADVYERAQREKLEMKFKQARESAKHCSQLECSVAAITHECIKLYEQLGSEIPTLVFSAKTWDGTALVDVKVEMNGEPLLDRLDGTPVSLDPGTYEFRFETAGYDPKVSTYVARVGDTNRLIEVVFGEAPPAPPSAPDASFSSTQLPPPPKEIPIASYVLGGVSLLGFGAFGYLRFSGIQDYNELNAKCAPECKEEDVQDIRTKFRASYIPLGVGAAALGGAILVYAVAGDSSSDPQADVSIVPIIGGAGAHLRARF